MCAQRADQGFLVAPAAHRDDTVALPGGELDVGTTICDEIRDSRDGVVIDHVAEDLEFHAHHTPLQYGFQSYISMPIIREDGSFFGTLCAIDPARRRVEDEAVVEMFTACAREVGAILSEALLRSRSEAPAMPPVTA